MWEASASAANHSEESLAAKSERIYEALEVIKSLPGSDDTAVTISASSAFDIINELKDENFAGYELPGCGLAGAGRIALTVVDALLCKLMTACERKTRGA
jgi:hypothetical protein